MSKTFDYEVQLIDVKKGINENGFEESLKVYKDKLLANKLSVRSSEYWYAKQSGVELSHVFQIHAVEYNGERGLRYNEKDYTIERTFQEGNYIELITLLWGDEHGT